MNSIEKMAHRTSYVGSRKDGEDVPGDKTRNPNDTYQPPADLMVSENNNNGGAPPSYHIPLPSSPTNPTTPKPVTRGLGRGNGFPKYLEPPKNHKDNVHGAPGRTRLAAAAASRGDEFDKGSSSVPRFGEWEDKDHVSVQGYTRTFDRIGEERPRNMPGGYDLSPRRRPPTPKQTKRNDSKSCCFFGKGWKV